MSQQAWSLCREAEIIDLHVESFLPVRLFGYDLTKHHRGWFGRPPLGGWLFGHFDLPRAEASGVTGGMWSITTQPFRSASGRWRAFLKNVSRLTRVLEGSGRCRVVGSYSAYRAARAAGLHPALLAVQGANAVDAASPDLADVPDTVVRMNLLHLTPSRLGVPSGAGGWWVRRKGLRDAGRDLVAAMNARRIFVDLAHIHRVGFWDAVDAHRRDLPFLVSHAGCDAVHRNWRNLTDAEIRAVAQSGGVVGVITAGLYLGGRRGASGAERFVDHVEHLIRVGGEDVAAIGTDFDGFIIPLPGIRGAHAYPLMVDAMLRRGLSEDRIRKVLGQNALRVLEAMRP